jgi:alpha-tubulin suppressor-like RCC1 family protein
LRQLGVGDFVHRPSPTLISALPYNTSPIYLRPICGPLVSYFLVISEHKQTIWQCGLIRRGKGEDKDIISHTPKELKVLIEEQSLSSSAAALWTQLLERNFIRNIQTGDGFTIFLTEEGKIYSLGDNEFGALGVGPEVRESQGPIKVSVSGASVCEIAVGWGHVLCLTYDNEIFSWGSNLHGQCGVGTKTNVFTPLRVRGLKNIIQIAAGQTHSIALDNKYNVWIWGSHRDGKLGIPNVTEDVLAPICLNEIFPEFKKEQIIQIASGCDHSCVLTRSGKVYVWGFGQHGALGTGTLFDAPTPQLLSVDLSQFGLQNYKITSVQCGMDVTLLTLTER